MRIKVKPGDLVEIFPEFLDDNNMENMGLIVREISYEESGRRNWFLVLRGEKLVPHPIDTFQRYYRYER